MCALVKRSLERVGVRAILAAPTAPVRAPGGLAVGDTLVTALYRYFPTEHMTGQRNLGAIEDAVRAGEARTLTSFSHLFAQSKLSMARAWARQADLAPEDAAVVREHVPESLDVIGWIAQRNAPQRAIATPFGDRLATLGAYVLDARLVGWFARLTAESHVSHDALVVLPSAEDAIARWQLAPDDAWARWEKLTLLTALGEAPESAHMPDVGTLPSVVRARWAAYQLVQAGVPDDTRFLVDLRGAASVAFGATLSQHATRPMSLVTTFNNWPHEDGLVPAEETLAALTTFDPRQPAPGERGAPVFLLDAWRLAYRDTVIEDGVTDNRYLLGAHDLPDAETRCARGITRVVYVVEDRGEIATEEDDVHEVMAAYEAAGLGVHLVDFARCEERADRRPWGVALSGVTLHVAPRPLVIHEREKSSPLSIDEPRACSPTAGREAAALSYAERCSGRAGTDSFYRVGGGR